MSCTPRSAMVRAAIASSSAADFVDHNHFRAVILNCFNHDLMLEAGFSNLHPTGMADRWMGHITIAGYFVGGGLR